MNAEFIACMENILGLYAMAYDAKYPVLCFDERPCFLMGDTKAPIEMKEGKVKKVNYSYEKNGSCALLAAIEPLTGRRIAKAYKQRTAKEYTAFMQGIAAAYPKAEKIRVVQDNLNTHAVKSFYAHLPADQAYALAQRFEFHFTPKSASWLNMIEIEFSALARQCLNTRIPTMEELEQKVSAVVKERNEKRIKINWQFSIKSARKTLNRHYQKVNPDNVQLLE